MSIYYFEVADRFPVIDADGIELETVDLAREHALHFASRVLGDESSDFWDTKNWVLTVHDEHRLALFSVTFAAENLQPAF
ncbi:DUF6894 family protein [Sphingomonas sp. GB1N7]|uniref:DUF6894 family protein n=1 Tax=Parasphingomonas caseinilytica TaxID=3096158 RepID=UPI002FCCB59C